MKNSTITHSVEFYRPPVEFSKDAQLMPLMSHSSMITAVITSVIDPDMASTDKLASKSIVFTVPSAISSSYISVIAVAHSSQGFATVSLTSSWMSTPEAVTTTQSKPVSVLSDFMKTALFGNNELVPWREEMLMSYIHKFLMELLYVSA